MSETPWFPEAIKSLGAVFRLARFDRSALTTFTDDVGQCARSFRACLFAFPLYCLARVTDLWGADLVLNYLAILVLAQIIAFVIECVIFPITALYLLRWFGREARWARLVTVYNWWQLGQTIIVAAVLLLHQVTGGGALSIDLLMVVYLFCLVVEGFIFEIVLETGLLTAATLVVIDLVLNYLVGVIANAIA